MKIIFIVALFFQPLAWAQNADIQKLQQQINLLSNEVLKLKSSSSSNVNEAPVKKVGNQGSSYSLGANKVYQVSQGVSLGGYGEIVYQDKQSGTATTDAYRFVPYIGYKFNDKLLINAEIEIEHDNEIYLEFAYLDYLHSEALNVRVGHILVPMGLVNLYHEPIFFNSVYRPEVEKNLIPSTWHENGVELSGQVFGHFNYRLGVVNSLNLSGTDKGGDPLTYSSSSWVRKGRQKASQARAEDLSYYARLDYKWDNGNELGASYYMGDSRQDNRAISSARLDLFDVHANMQFANFKMMALYTLGNLADTHQITGGLGKKAEGFYIDAAYDVGKHFGTKSVSVFTRYSEYDLHKEVVSSVAKDKTLHKTITTVGVNFKPHNQVVIKADYQIRENKQENEANYFNLGMGFVF